MATLTKANIIEAVYEQTNKSRADVNAYVDHLIALISNGIAKDHKLLLSGFGCFDCYGKKPRLGRNPQTNESITIDARKVVVFRVSKTFRMELNSKAE